MHACTNNTTRQFVGSCNPDQQSVKLVLPIQVEHNLYGMGFIRLRKARFRGQLPARGRETRAGWNNVPEVLTYEEASTGGTSASLISELGSTSSECTPANCDGLSLSRGICMLESGWQLKLFSDG